jgi:methyl-accepting chemotaxis protein
LVLSKEYVKAKYHKDKLNQKPMNWINNLKIGLRLNIILGLLMVAIISSLGVYIYFIQKRNWVKTIDQQMNEQVKDIVGFIDSRVKGDMAEISATANLAKELSMRDEFFSIDKSTTEQVKITNQIDKTSKEISLPQLYFKGKKLYKNFEIVDVLSKQTSTLATIFQRIDDGYLRISTTVTKENGERAINTYIPDSSPVAQAINKGETYSGRAFVVNDWCHAVYKPIKINGEIQGMIFSGISEKKNFSIIQDYIQTKKYFENGYPFIVDKSGIIVLHPEKKIKNIKDEQFFINISQNTNKKGSVECTWDGETCNMYYEYYKDMEVYVLLKVVKSESLKSIHAIRNLIIIAVLVAILLFFIANRFISRSITRGLVKIVSFAQELASGQLNSTLSIKQKDEIGDLAIALNIMSEKLKDVIVSIQSGAQSISVSCNEISKGSLQLAEGSNEQASSTEEVSASMEQMLANIEQNTANASSTEEIANKASVDIEKISSAVISTVEEMKKITEKTSIIGTIAEKTDLLAINAAIEAARAGDHGLGFNVVASEIRKLAERSQKAARQIEELTNSSFKIAFQSGSELSKLVPDIKKTLSLIQEIADSNFQQNSNATQVNSAMVQLNEVTQQNAATAEQFAANAKEMQLQAQNLEELVAYFNLT